MLNQQLPNNCLQNPESNWNILQFYSEFGINFPQYRERAIVIGEKLGIYREYPVSKGCTSPFAPIWINEMVRRQGPAK